MGSRSWNQPFPRAIDPGKLIPEAAIGQNEHSQGLTELYALGQWQSAQLPDLDQSSQTNPVYSHRRHNGDMEDSP
jgi:hypothetical protein